MRKIISYKHIIIFTVILSVFISAFLLIRNNPLYDDEYAHYEQINYFLSGKYTTISPVISVIPGYHLTIATIATILHKKNLPELRFIHVAISLFSVLIFYSISKIFDKNNAKIKTMQYAFFPLLYPYFFHLYVEPLMMLCILLSLMFCLKKKYYLAGIWSTLAVLVKQTSIFFLLLIFILSIVQEKKNHPLKKCLFFFLGIALFIGFVIINKGIAIGTQNMHPNFSINSGNIAFALFVFFFLNLAENIKNVTVIFKKLLARKLLFFPIVLFLFISTFTFVNNHPWNQYPEHIRNSLLLFFTSTIYLKFIFFILVSYSVLSLSIIKFYNSSFYLLYPITFVLLTPIWLIETRYGIPTFVLFILFKKSQSLPVEIATIVLYIVLDIALFQGYIHQSFYL